MKRQLMSLVLLSLLGGAAGAVQLAPNAAVVLVHGAPLYDETNKALKALEYLTLGDIVTLMGRTANYNEAGTARDFTRVKAMDGKEGWVRSQYIAAKASLAIVMADESIIYTEPRDVKLTDRHITGMTLVAVLQDGSSASFAKVQGYDTVQKALFTDSTFVRTEDLTASDADVNAGILYIVSLATKDPAVKKNLLRVALAKYRGSLFIDKIQAAYSAAP